MSSIVHRVIAVLGAARERVFPAAFSCCGHFSFSTEKQEKVRFLHEKRPASNAGRFAFF